MIRSHAFASKETVYPVIETYVQYINFHFAMLTTTARRTERLLPEGSRLWANNWRDSVRACLDCSPYYRVSWSLLQHVRKLKLLRDSRGCKETARARCPLSQRDSLTCRVKSFTVYTVNSIMQWRNGVWNIKLSVKYNSEWCVQTRLKKKKKKKTRA